MSNITITFLGKEYSIPEDVLVYIGLLDFTEGVKNQLMSTFVGKVKSELNKDNSGLLDDEDLAASIEQQVGRFISKLCDNGIFSRTVSDYLNNNKGYQYVSDVNKAALGEIKSYLIERLDSLKEGLEEVGAKADSRVTGLGFSIFSGSFINHAIYAAMEASKLNEQEKEADAIWRKETHELTSRLESEYNKKSANYISKQYIPNMEAALTVLAYELLDRYVADLITYHKFDAKAMDYINIGRSNDLLKNLSFSENKRPIIENAFTACPYNIAVYIEAIKNDLLDYESFQTAKIFKLESRIITFLEENLGGSATSEKKRLHFKNAELLSLYTGRSLREITSYVADFIVKGYAQTVAALTNNTPCYNIMNKADERDILAGDRISREKAAWLVDPLAPTILWDKLTLEYGHTDLFNRLLSLLPDKPEVNSKTEYDAFLKERLFAILETIRQERVAAIHAQRQEEARKKEEVAEEAKRRAKRNKKIITLGLIVAVIAIIVAIVSAIINKVNNEKAYQAMSGKFCVYRAINDDGEERNEFNWWLSIETDGTMKLSSWSHAFENTTVNSYSGTLMDKADFRKFEDYRIEDYCADASDYEKAKYCYEFHIADQWNEFDGYIVCWQYANGKLVDVYCDDYRYSFVELDDRYSFDKWEAEINSDRLSKNVQSLVDKIDISVDDAMEQIENQIGNGRYDEAVAEIVSSILPDEQKESYYKSLISELGFASFDVNGLVVHIPEHWYTQDYNDPNVTEASYPEEDSRVFWYVKYMGTADEVAAEDNDYWKKRNDFSKSSISGCANAYVRFDSGYDNGDEQYFVIEHFVECEGQVYQLQYLAYEDRYFEPELWMLLDHVEFTNYAENRVDIQEQTYLNALDLLAEGKYEEALFLLEKVGDYKDAAALKEKYAVFACEAGDVIIFGTYEQDNELNNGAEAIEWIVLERDGDKVLVISKYCIEWLPFHNTVANVDWKNCSIRSWLNNTFLSEAFTKQEQSYIISTQNSNPDFYDDSEDERYALGITTDRVFLLSSGEADRYFSSDADRQTVGTEYACDKANSDSWFIVNSASHFWWLRSANNIEVAGFVSDGELGYGQDVDRYMGIRPAMWMELPK